MQIALLHKIHSCNAIGRGMPAQVICERGSKLNKDTLAIMPYADATIKEALRLGAIINIVPKRALKTFEIGGYTIPKASPVPVPSCASTALLAASVLLDSIQAESSSWRCS